MSAYDGHDVRF